VVLFVRERRSSVVLRRTCSSGGLAIDLEPLLRGLVFEPLFDDYALFKRLRVDSEAGTTV
jgi:hypothetical protein